MLFSNFNRLTSCYLKLYDYFMYKSLYKICKYNSYKLELDIISHFINCNSFDMQFDKFIFNMLKCINKNDLNTYFI